MNNVDVMKALCEASNKFGMFISFGFTNAKEVELATNGRLNWQEHMTNMLDGQAIFLFDTEEELDLAFDDMVGDDGPTNRNSYDGEIRVYALTCSASGELLTENT